MAKSKGIHLGRSTAKGARNTSTQRLKKRKVIDAFDDAPIDSFLLADEDGAAPAPQEEEEEQEQEETAEQKRLRIDEAFEGVTGGEEDAVAQRLQQEAMDALGYNQRRLADRVLLPPLPCAPPVPSSFSAAAPAFRMLQGHWQTVTCCCITADEATVFAVGKDGRVLRWEMATGTATQLEMVAPATQDTAGQTVADWAPKPARTVAAHALLACAVSTDGKFLAVGGADKKVHVFDAPSGQYLQGYKGHQDVVTCLAFRQGTHTLLSGSTDRQVKIWSLDDSMYIDTLYGHQAEVLCLDMLRAERAVTGGNDRTCRVWKIPEESQLVFRAPAMSIESVAYISGGEWVSGGTDGTLCLWSNQRKKPSVVVAHAHSDLRDDSGQLLGSGCCNDSDACRWVTAVAVARSSDLVASAAGSGVVRFWAVKGTPGHRELVPLGGVAVRGFVSALRFGDSGRVLVAAVGQEPRMGRWGCDKVAVNGVAVIDVPLTEDVDA